jgi:hypothetical protein
MPPNPEVSDKRKYRCYAAEYKARIVEEAERDTTKGPRPKTDRALSDTERQNILDVLHS